MAKDVVRSMRVVFGVGSKRDYSIFGSDGRELVESVQTSKLDSVTVKQVHAEAHLFAAALDLYEALKVCRHALSDRLAPAGEALQAAIALADLAIAKAEGHERLDGRVKQCGRL